MYYFVTDETNTEASTESKFFIYGGLVLSSEQFVAVHLAVEKIRADYGFQPGDELKFNTNTRPSHLDPTQHREVKNAVIEACKAVGVKFISYMIHHNIVEPANKDRYALNTAVATFNSKFLAEHEDHGIVFIDRLPDNAAAFGMLQDKFQNGLQLSIGITVKLNRIVMYAATCNGASHISSAVDIVLGGLRWVVNSKDKPDVVATQRSIFQNIASMMYAKEFNGKLNARERGLILRPENIKAQVYKIEYDQLVSHLASLLSDAS